MDEGIAELQGTGSGRTEQCMAAPFLLCFPEHPFKASGITTKVCLEKS